MSKLPVEMPVLLLAFVNSGYLNPINIKHFSY